MKLLHLADLHLGKSVLETSMLPVQREVLTQAADYAVRERAGGILLAGDIYDRSVPPVEAVELLDGFLERLELEGIPVLAIPATTIPPNGCILAAGSFPAAASISPAASAESWKRCLCPTGTARCGYTCSLFCARPCSAGPASRRPTLTSPWPLSSEIGRASCRERVSGSV